MIQVLKPTLRPELLQAFLQTQVFNSDPQIEELFSLLSDKKEEISANLVKLLIEYKGPIEAQVGAIRKEGSAFYIRVDGFRNPIRSGEEEGIIGIKLTLAENNHSPFLPAQLQTIQNAKIVLLNYRTGLISPSKKWEIVRRRVDGEKYIETAQVEFLASECKELLPALLRGRVKMPSSQNSLLISLVQLK